MMDLIVAILLIFAAVSIFIAIYFANIQRNHIGAFKWLGVSMAIQALVFAIAIARGYA